MSDPITPLDPQETQQQEEQAKKEGYLHRTLVGLDQFANVITGGKPDETISSRAARASLKGNKFGKLVSKFLNVFQKDHGAKAIAGDDARAEQIEQAEEGSGGIAVVDQQAKKEPPQ